MKEREVIETMAVIKFDITEAAIAELSKRYMGLVVKDLDDKESFDEVHEAKMVIVHKRGDVEKRRKVLKADALEYGRKVDAEAKRIVGLLAPIEAHLQAEEQKVIDEKKRVEDEKLRVFTEMVNGRVQAFMVYGVVLSFADVAGMNDAEFDMKLVGVKTDYENEQQRLAKEEQERIDRQAELDRQAEEQAKRDREQAAEEEVLRIERQALQAERDKLEKEKREEQERIDQRQREAKEKEERIAFEKQAIEDARIQAEQDAKDEIARAIEEARIAVEEAETARLLQEAEAKRKADLLPDKEKIIAWGKSLRSVTTPETKDHDAQVFVVTYQWELDRLIGEIIEAEVK